LLREYGYETSFLIRNDYCVPKINKDKTRKIALTDEAFRILHSIFEAHCDDNKYLDKNGLLKIFSPVPSVVDFHNPMNFNYLLAADWAETTDPWGSLSFPYCCAVQYTDDGFDYKIDEAGFKAMWMLGTSVDYQVVLKHFAYLGYSISQGHNLSKYNSLSSCSLLHVSIFGQNGAGKSSLIYAQQIVTSSNPIPTEAQRNVPRTQNKNMELAFRNDKRNYGIYFHTSKDKWLVLEELTEKDQAEYLNEKKDRTTNVTFDLAIFLCDQSNVTSCQHTTQLLERFLALEVKKPYEIVLTKTDLLADLPIADRKKAEYHFKSLGYSSLPISKNQDLSPFFSTIIQKAIQGYTPPFEWNLPLLGIGVAVTFLILLGASIYLTRSRSKIGTSSGLSSGSNILRNTPIRVRSVWLE